MRRIRIVLTAGLALAALLGGAPFPDQALAVPANDNLASAVTIVTPAVSGVVAGLNNVGASTGSTIWFNWTSPNSSGTVAFDTLGSNFDTTLAIFTGNAFPLTQVGCNDNAFGASALGLNYSPNTTYRIQLGGKSGASGNSRLSMATGAAIYVTTTNDENDGTINGFHVSLREAILFATDVRDPSGLESVRVIGSPGVGSSDLIHFDKNVFVPGTILLGSGLPDLSAAGDVISGIGTVATVDGQNSFFTCFSVSGNGNQIEGFVIKRCAGTGSAYGVWVSGSNNVIGSTLAVDPPTSIAGNDLGVGFAAPGTGNKLIRSLIGFEDSVGYASLPNLVGVIVFTSGNTIGGSGPFEGNLLADATYEILRITGSGASGNVVMGNRFGVDRDGFLECCGLYDVRIDTGAHDNIIGGSGPGEGNLIANATNAGLQIDAASSNTVLGNTIGRDGSSGVANGFGVRIDGLSGFATGNIIGGSAPGEGNVVSGNAGWGVDIIGLNATLNRVIGNRIGVTPTGAALGNGWSGVRFSGALDNLIGGTASGEGNIIAYNGVGGFLPEEQAGVVGDGGQRNTIR
jgi:titin